MSKNTDGALPRPIDIDSAAHRFATDRLVYPPAAGEISDAFRPSNLARSNHPALQGGRTGGDVAQPSHQIIDGAGGRLNRQ
jgi:hypothetical protein